MTLYAVVRLRGSAQKPKDINYALKILGLTRANHCILLKDSSYSRGQLKKLKDYITYGEIDDEILKLLIKKRGRLLGNKRLDDSFFKENPIEKLIEACKEDPKSLSLFGIKKVFRLKPASKGLKSIKLSYKQGGDLGYRGSAINDLLKKMI